MPDRIVAVRDHIELRHLGDGPERRHQATRHRRHEQVLGAPDTCRPAELGRRGDMEHREAVFVSGHGSGLRPRAFEMEQVVV